MNFVGVVILFIVGAVAGSFIVGILLKNTDLSRLSFLESMGSFFLMFVLLGIAIYAQVIIHEGGQLVFGLLSGYKFLSFRIGSMLIQRIDGKMEFKRNFPSVFRTQYAVARLKDLDDIAAGKANLEQSMVRTFLRLANKKE